MRFGTILTAVLVLAGASGAIAAEPLGLKVPEGFTVTQYAGDDLAHDIYSLTIDTAGRVVVSGPGYVRILVDADRDGKAEKAINFAEGPASGAQGMAFLGRDLFCTGDGGLIRYKDDNKDDRADGPPQVFLKLKTGGEHNAHAVRRGPDGRWWLLVGNTTEIDETYVTQKNSPIKFPHGGVLLRLAADLSGAEAFGDGFRNAYDFDFNAQGEPFVYDSDGERDVSLPWYRPSRLFHVLRGGEHGWITDQWKRPDFFLDSAPVVMETGRSSPTGVVCYRHVQFPAAYRNGMFALDWTFGRIHYVPMTRAGSTWAAAPQVFLSTDGAFGFAPTDADVGIDGSLYVCAGGRGTQGAVYRIAYTGKGGGDPVPAIIRLKETSSPAEKLAACVNSPMPHAAWSRARWLPVAKALGPEAFAGVAVDEKQSTDARVRAVEILTELFGGLPPQLTTDLARSESPEVRARAAWSISMDRTAGSGVNELLPYLNDADPLVRRAAVETLWSSGLPAGLAVPGIAGAMNDADRCVRLSSARMVVTMEPTAFRALSEATRQLGWRASMTNSIGYLWRQAAKSDGFNPYGLELGRRVLEGNHAADLKLEAVRVLQIALADIGPDGSFPPAFDGYCSPIPLKKHQKELESTRQMLVRIFPTGDANRDQELARVAAMIGVPGEAFLTKLLTKLMADSHPVDDLHYLAAAARTTAKPTPQQRTKLAAALVLLDQKLSDRKLYQDANWKDRVAEIYGSLVEMDEALPVAILEHPNFGRPNHVMFMSKLPPENLPQAIVKFTKSSKAPDFAWNTDVIFVIGYDKSDEHFATVREHFDQFDLRMAVLMVLATKPQEQDRQRFAEGLDSGPIEVLTTCIDALEKLPAKQDPEELSWLVKLLRRMGTDPSEYPLRERVVALLERNAGTKFPFVAGEAGHKPQPECAEKWTAWVTAKHPSAALRILGGAEVSLPDLKKRLLAIDWTDADADRGRRLFESKSCAVCHSGPGGIGPDLAGITGRFSRDDLFVAIAAPNRDVSPRYQSILIRTKAGQQYTGMIVYENVDGLVLRNSANQSFRLSTGDIEDRRNLSTSLMPSGLLNGLQDRDLADLYRYLQSRSGQTAQAPTGKTMK